MELRGDDRQLLVVLEGVDKLGRVAILRRELSAVLGAAAIERLGHEFESGTDPYGEPWKPTTSRDGQTLRDTGRLLNAFHFRARGDGFKLGNAVKYAGTHQYGATITAKTSRGLIFKVAHGTQLFNKRTGAPLKRRKVLSHWVRVQKVVIPQRQMVPEGDLGPIWSAEFARDAATYIEQIFAA